jgi:seryl-tRNA synthetase
MLDPRLFIESPDVVRASLRRRGASEEMLATVDRLVDLNTRRRALVTEGDRCRAVRNELSPRIGAAMKAGDTESATRMKAEVRTASDRAAAIEAELVDVAGAETDLLLALPNLVDPETPDGISDNPVVRTWGTPRAFDFAPKPHDEVALGLGLYDPERAAKLAGSRFAVLSGSLAALERALISFYLDVAVHEHGYTEVAVPYLVTAETMRGTGQLPKFEEDLFKLTAQLGGQDAYLIPTAEVPVTNLHRDEILDEEVLPIRYAAYTPCFRSEAGAAGRDTRGLIRVHQFSKVELVWVTRPEDSAAALETLTGHAETLLQRLGLPYRTVARCAGDVGNGGARGYDIELWLPAQQAYREVSSCTSFTDFQTRRLKLRFRREKKNLLCHTLNGSGLPAGRVLAGILENFQEADGSVVIPEVLRPWLRGLDRLTPRR